MMMVKQQLVLLGWLSLMLSTPSSVVGQEPCLAADVEDCALEDRVCVSGGSNETDMEAICGPCMDEFFEWERVGGCFNISDLTLEDFVDALAPFYKETRDAGSPTLLERLQFLKESAEFIGDYYRSRVAGGDVDESFELSLTAFSADGPTEYSQRSGFQADLPKDRFANDVPVPTTFAPTMIGELPATLDWRNRGAVTEVKDQGRCGCCWAISMVGAIEGAAAANPENNGYLQNLSWQQLISCNDGNLGCDGGSLVIALGYSWLNKYGGVSRNNEYPYTDYQGDTTDQCAVTSKPLAVQIADPKIVLDFGAPFDFDTRVTLMKEALQVAPVSMTIKSACKTLSNYRKGILTADGDCACSSSSCIDHAILMVGYDDTSSPASWILKNSWGTGWGEDGYFRISQQEKGSWGLFGVVSHGVQAQLAQNVTGQVQDNELDDPLNWWAWVLIALAGAAVCICLLGLLRKMQAPKEGEQ